MMVGMKSSLRTTLLMDRQSVVGSPIMIHNDSMAILTVSGGLGSERTSTKCYLMDFTARGRWGGGREGGGREREGGGRE